MNRMEAWSYVKNNFPYDPGQSDYIALFRLRHKAICLPEIGVNGQGRDEADWCYIDACGKIDTGEYGDIYYF